MAFKMNLIFLTSYLPFRNAVHTSWYFDGSISMSAESYVSTHFIVKLQSKLKGHGVNFVSSLLQFTRVS